MAQQRQTRHDRPAPATAPPETATADALGSARRAEQAPALDPAAELAGLGEEEAEAQDTASGDGARVEGSGTAAAEADPAAAAAPRGAPSGGPAGPPTPPDPTATGPTPTPAAQGPSTVEPARAVEATAPPPAVRALPTPAPVAARLGGFTPLVAPRTRLPADQAEALTTATGHSPSQHLAAADAALATVRDRATTVQAEGVDHTRALGGALAELARQHGTAAATEARSTAATVDQTFRAGAQQVRDAATAAGATLQATAASARARASEAATAHGEGLRTQHAAQADVYRQLREPVMAPLRALLSEAAAATEAAAAEAATGFDGLDVDSAYPATGDALQRWLGGLRAAHARAGIPRAREDVIAGGRTRAAEVLAMEAALTAQVDAFLMPLAGVVVQQGETGAQHVGARAASGDATLAAEAGRAEADVAARADETATALAADGTRTAAQAEAAGAQAEADAEARAHAAEAAMSQLASGQAESLRGALAALSEALPAGELLTAEQAEAFAEAARHHLDTVHDAHRDTADDLAERLTRGEDEADAEARDGLASLAEQALGTAADTVSAGVSGLDEAARGLVDGLDTLAADLDADLRATAEPMVARLQAHRAEVDAQVAALRERTRVTLDQQLAAYRAELSTSVSGYLERVRPQAMAAARSKEERLEGRARGAHQAMRGMGTKEDALFDALRGLGPGEPGALRVVFSSLTGTSLDARLSDELDEEEHAIASAHLGLRHGEAARLEIDDNVRWWGDDEAQIETILRGIPEDERASLASDPAWASTRDQLARNLDGTDLAVSQALLDGNTDRADALRLRDTIDAARRARDDDALHDALAGMDPERLDGIAAEFAQLDGVSEAVGAEAGDDARATLAAFATRDLTTGRGRGRRTRHLDDSSASLATALVVDGADSATARAARFQVELERRGGPDAARLETALYGSADLRQRLHSEDAATRDAAAAELAAQQRDFEQAWADATGTSAADALAALDVSEGERALYEQMRQDGTNTPAVAALQIREAVRGVGTDEEAIERALTGMSPDEIAQLRRAYPDLEADLGVNGAGGFFTELSGDDRQRVELLLHGDAAHMDADQRFALAREQFEQQRGDESTWLGRTAFSDTEEAEALEQHWADLRAFRQTHATDFVGGTFRGTPEAYEQYRRLCRYVGVTAELYQAQVDRVANGVTTAVAVTGAVAAAVVTGGAATPLVAAAVAGGTGAATMATNAVLKGGRYGWETAAADLGITAVSAATAGVGQRLNSLRHASGQTVGILGSTNPNAIAGGKAIVGGGTAFVNASAGTAMQDETWRSGAGDGLGEVLYSGLRGGASGAVGSGVSARFGVSRLGQRWSDSQGTLTRGTAKALEGGLQESTGSSTRLGVDAMSGRYTGELEDALGEIGLSTLQGTGQGFLEGAAELRQAQARALAQRLTAGGRVDDEATAALIDGPDPARVDAPTPPAAVDEDATRLVQAEQAVARLDAAETDAATLLASTDASEARRVEALNTRASEAPEAVTRGEVQAVMDDVADRVTAVRHEVVDDVQDAAADADTALTEAERALQDG